MNTAIIITIIICFTVICVVHMWTDAAKALFSKPKSIKATRAPVNYNKEEHNHDDKL